MTEEETFFVVETPDGDRRYIVHKVSSDYYAWLKTHHPGSIVYKIVVHLPVPDGQTHDFEVVGAAEPWEPIE